MKIYTRTGDAGTSALYTGERRAKDDQIFEALGVVDELNSQIGLARYHSKENGLDDYLAEIQSRLLDVGSHLATPLNSANETKIKRTQFGSEHAEALEKTIDILTESLPPLKNFILPGGSASSCHLHLCRTTCRTAERRIVPLADQVDPGVLKYMNRLSDFFFTAARYACLKDGTPEVVYKKDK